MGWSTQGMDRALVAEGLAARAVGSSAQVLRLASKTQAEAAVKVGL